LSIIYESWLLFFHILSVSFRSEAIYSVGAFSQRMTRDYYCTVSIHSHLGKHKVLLHPLELIIVTVSCI